MGRGAYDDRGRANLVGVLSHHPASGAVIGGMQQQLPLTWDAVGCKLIEEAADQLSGSRMILTLEANIAGDDFLRGVHDVHGLSVLCRQPCGGLGHNAGDRGVVNCGHDDCPDRDTGSPSRCD
jgi:hypothetical protein